MRCMIPCGSGFTEEKPTPLVLVTVAPKRPSRAAAKRRRPIRRGLEGKALALCVGVALAWLGGSLLWPKSSPDLASRSFSTVSVTVAPGDTLWSLAQRYEDPSLRPAERMDMIRQANPQLTASSALSVGQTLLVPVTADTPAVEGVQLARR